MINTKETSSDKAEMKNHGRGMQFLKFGAKKSGMWQPCNVGEGFKTMDAACKKTTVTIHDVALENSAKQRLTQLRNHLPCGCKLDAVVDCIATAPHTQNDAHHQKCNTIALLRSGMLSSES
jgi:enoyl-[acyl-carrier-protein] reductase (NADH)